MIEIALPLLLMAASAQVERAPTSSSPEATETAKPGACRDGGPLVALLVTPAFGPAPQPMGVLVAIWSNGRIVRAKDGVNPENGRVEGRLDAATMDAVYRPLKEITAIQTS